MALLVRTPSIRNALTLPFNDYHWEDLVMITIDLSILTSIAVITSCVIAVLSAVVFPMARKFKKFSDGWDDFMRDWKGEEEEPGRDKAPGVMERLNDIDGEFKKNSEIGRAHV